MSEIPPMSGEDGKCGKRYVLVHFAKFLESFAEVNVIPSCTQDLRRGKLELEKREDDKVGYDLES